MPNQHNNNWINSANNHDLSEYILTTWNYLEATLSTIDNESTGQDMMSLMRRLFPICRSITGNGLRESLGIIQEYIPLNLSQVSTGYHAFDWTVPKEWNIQDAFIKNSHGDRVVDFKKSNLHVLNYSHPINGVFTLGELRNHLYTLPDMPDAIPYITSYYEERWGFCLTENQLNNLSDDKYEVVIDSSLTQGHLNYGDLIIKGLLPDEILFSTYLCHPSMANNELSGPVLVTFLNKIISGCNLTHTYRSVFVPETIGSIVYLSKHGSHLRDVLKAGYVATCVGDPGPYTYKRSKLGNSLADKIAEHCLKHISAPNSTCVMDFFPSGSDERQYCSPGFNLPVGSLMRSAYGTYPQYHTSLDDLNFVTSSAMLDSLKAYLRLVQTHELNHTYINLSPYCEPQLSKRNIYPTIGTAKSNPESVQKMLYLLAYSDGSRDLVDIASIATIPAWDFGPEICSLIDEGLLGIKDPSEL